MNDYKAEKVENVEVNMKIILKDNEPMTQRARLCLDYILLNGKIVRDRYRLRLIEDQLDSLQCLKVFSTLDLSSEFFHVVAVRYFKGAFWTLQFTVSILKICKCGI